MIYTELYGEINLSRVYYFRIFSSTIVQLLIFIIHFSGIFISDSEQDRKNLSVILYYVFIFRITHLWTVKVF